MDLQILVSWSEIVLKNLLFKKILNLFTNGSPVHLKSDIDIET